MSSSVAVKQRGVSSTVHGVLRRHGGGARDASLSVSAAAAATTTTTVPLPPAPGGPIVLRCSLLFRRSGPGVHVPVQLRRFTSNNAEHIAPRLETDVEVEVAHRAASYLRR